jgi:hypothetical protein
VVGEAADLHDDLGVLVEAERRTIFALEDPNTSAANQPARG